MPLFERAELALDILPRIGPMVGMGEFTTRMEEMKTQIRGLGAAGVGGGAAGAAYGAHSAVNAATNVGMGVAGGIGAIGYLSVQDAVQTEGAANRIRAAHSISKASFEEYTKFIESKSTSLLTGQKELWGGIGQAIAYNFGVKGTEAVTAGVAKMSKVLGGEFAPMMKGVTGILGAFHITAAQIPQTLDALTVAASKSGQGANFFSTGAGRFLVQAQGIGATLPESLGIATEITRMGLGNRAAGAYGNVLSRLGNLQSTPGYGNLVDIQKFGIEGSLANLINAPNATPDALKKLLGGGIGLTLSRDIVKAGPQGADLGNTQGALDTKFLEYSKSSAASLDSMRLSVKNLEEAIGKGLIPVVKSATGFLTPLVKGTTALAERFPTASKVILESATALGILSLGIRVAHALFAPFGTSAAAAAVQVTKITVAEGEVGSVGAATAPKLALVESGIAGIGTVAERTSGLLIPMNTELGATGTLAGTAALKTDAAALGIGRAGAAAEVAAPKMAILSDSLKAMAPEILAIVLAMEVMNKAQENNWDLGKWAKTIGGYFLDSPIDPLLHHFGLPTLKDVVGKVIPGLTDSGSPTGAKTGGWTTGAGHSIPGSTFGAFQSPSTDYMNRQVDSQFYRTTIGGKGPYLDTDFMTKSSSPTALKLPGHGTWQFVKDLYDPTKGGGGKGQVWVTPEGNTVIFWDLQTSGTPGKWNKGLDSYGFPSISGAKPLVPGKTYKGGTQVGIAGHGPGDTGNYHLCIVTDQNGREELVRLTGGQIDSARKSGKNVAVLTQWEQDHLSEIKAAADKHGIPVAAMLATLDSESSGGMDPKAGINVMQIDPSSGMKMPASVGQSLDEGAGYLAQNYTKYGDWQQTFQHYNGKGPAAIAYGKRVNARFNALGGAYTTRFDSPTHTPLPTTPKETEGSLAWWEARLSTDQKNFSSSFAGVDPSKLTGQPLANYIDWVRRIAHDTFKVAAATTDAQTWMSQGRKDSEHAGEWNQYMAIWRNPLGKVKGVSNPLQLAADQEAYDAQTIATRWSGVDPTKLSKTGQSQWLQAMYKENELERQNKDNLAKIAFHTKGSHMTLTQLHQRLAADNAAKNTANQADRARLNKAAAGQGDFVVARITDQRCAAEEHANVHRKKTAHNTKLTADTTAAALDETKKQLAATKQLHHSIDSLSKVLAHLLGGPSAAALLRSIGGTKPVHSPGI